MRSSALNSGRLFDTYYQTISPARSALRRPSVSLHQSSRCIRGGPGTQQRFRSASLHLWDWVLLTRPSRIALSQIHSGFCLSLMDYPARIGAADSFLRPGCEAQDQAVVYVFSCTANPPISRLWICGGSRWMWRDTFPLLAPSIYYFFQGPAGAALRVYSAVLGAVSDNNYFSWHL